MVVGYLQSPPSPQSPPVEQLESSQDTHGELKTEQEATPPKPRPLSPAAQAPIEAPEGTGEDSVETSTAAVSDKEDGCKDHNHMLTSSATESAPHKEGEEAKSDGSQGSLPPVAGTENSGSTSTAEAQVEDEGKNRKEGGTEASSGGGGGGQWGGMFGRLKKMVTPGSQQQNEPATSDGGKVPRPSLNL